MKMLPALGLLKTWDKKGRYIFTKHVLSKLFTPSNPKTFSENLRRLVEKKILIRACRGIYVYPDATCFDRFVLEHIAKALRCGEYNYISLESALSQYGVISQMPVDRLTIMTTGREGIYHTPYGTIEMTHTKRSANDILNNTQLIEKNPLRIATKSAAIRDLKRVGRNINLLQEGIEE